MSKRVVMVVMSEDQADHVRQVLGAVRMVDMPSGDVGLSMFSLHGALTAAGKGQTKRGVAFQTDSITIDLREV